MADRVITVRRGRYKGLPFRDKAKSHAESRMGDRRFFLCPFGIVDANYIEKHFPDHGLLSPQGRKISVLRIAPVRSAVNHRAEVRYLRFALIHVRSNLLKVGCSVNLAALCQFFGADGISLPVEKRAFYVQPPLEDLVAEVTA